jgi:hypothetical protein
MSGSAATRSAGRLHSKSRATPSYDLSGQLVAAATFVHWDASGVAKVDLT